MPHAEFVTVTEQMIAAAATSPTGGWSAAQLALLGVPWPPPKGWRTAAVGRRVPAAAAERFVAQRRPGDVAPAVSRASESSGGTAEPAADGLTRVVVHTDGACVGNPGPGGYAAILWSAGRCREVSGGRRRTTNNRMEILAAVAALEALTRPCRVVVHSDSRYLVDAIQQGWAARWRANGWKRNDKDKAVNSDLWGRLLDLAAGHQATFVWVRGHAGHPDNERCDRLAAAAARAPDLPPDDGYEAAEAAARRPTLFG